MNINANSFETKTLKRLVGEKDSRYFGQPALTYGTPRRILLIDDDPSFLAIMKRLAIMEGVGLECFERLEDLGFIELFKSYDAAILDYDLGGKTGIDISQYISCFVTELPILIISAKDRTQECRDLPRCVKSVLRKSAGYRYILDLAVRLSQPDDVNCN